jgi:hypothetical protein
MLLTNFKFFQINYKERGADVANHDDNNLKQFWNIGKNKEELIVIYVSIEFVIVWLTEWDFRHSMMTDM